MAKRRRINRKVKIMSGSFVAAFLLSGCAAGYEVGGRAGLYRVDETHQSSQSFRADNKSLKCWLFDCPAVTAEKQEAAHGS